MIKKGKVPSLITGSSGKPCIEEVKKQRKCNRCGKAIIKGSKCFVIPKVGSGFVSKKSYCTDCFEDILGQSFKDLKKLEHCLAAVNN